MPVTSWDREETRDLHKQALLGHDLLVNCVVTHTPTTPFVEQSDLGHDERRLRVLADVTCDVTGPTNMLPVNTRTTTWQEPVRRLHGGTNGHSLPLDVIAIDNLPSLLPREASEGFSAELIRTCWTWLWTAGRRCRGGRPATPSMTRSDGLRRREDRRSCGLQRLAPLAVPPDVQDLGRCTGGAERRLLT